MRAKADEDRRDYILHARLTPGEWALIESARGTVERSEWCRQVLIASATALTAPAGGIELVRHQVAALARTVAELSPSQAPVAQRPEALP